MSTEYTVQIGMDEEYEPMGRVSSLGRGKGTVFVWYIHPHRLFTHLRVWVRSEGRRSWPLEGFEYVILRHCKIDYSQIGE